MTTDGRIIESGNTDVPFSEIRFLFLPRRDLFAQRAGRFRSLAKGHSLGEYLAFLALLADAQQAALDTTRPVSPPDPGEQGLCREQGKPPLDARSLPRDPAWREGLAVILRQMDESTLPPAAHETVTGLMQASDTRLEEMADRILEGDLTDVSPREFPFVAAALQVHWVEMAAGLNADACARLEQGGICPVCGSFPTASIVHTGGTEQGLRYLSCSLCASQWHMVRLKCCSCESTHGINHHVLEGADGAVKAESCDDCATYLKILYLEKDRQMEATADDLATLALDMLMEKEGMSRGGPNLYFHPGTV